MGTQSQSAGACGRRRWWRRWPAAAGVRWRRQTASARRCPRPPRRAIRSTFPALAGGDGVARVGRDHALYALGQWLQDGSVRRCCCARPTWDIILRDAITRPIDQFAAVDRSPVRSASQPRPPTSRASRSGAAWTQARPGSVSMRSALPRRPAHAGRRRRPGTTMSITYSSSSYWVSRDAGEYFERRRWRSPTRRHASPSVLMTFLADPELPAARS